MKALCVKQPFAFLLVDKNKTLEIRSWRTEYRGELLICASAAPKNHFWRDESVQPGVRRLLPAGCILGIVHLVDVRPMQKKDAWEGGAWCDYQKDAYAWVIDVPKYRPCRPDKIVGKLHLFDVPDDKIVELEKGDDFYNYLPPQGEVKFTKSCPIF